RERRREHGVKREHPEGHRSRVEQRAGGGVVTGPDGSGAGGRGDLGDRECADEFGDRGAAAGDDGHPVPRDPVEQTVSKTVVDIAHGVRVVSERHRAKLTADRLYDHAYAVAYMAHEGPQTEKKYAAEKATQTERIDKDVAEVAYQHALRQMKALEGKLSAFQTIAKSV
ncbi:hypothetical protein IAE22_30600, partial [Bacillus sp. S34]|nr:hypothetical protein [Bacillus sp. S34]